MRIATIAGRKRKINFTGVEKQLADTRKEVHGDDTTGSRLSQESMP